MKKTILFPLICLIGLFFLLNGCGGGKYADAIKLNQEYISYMKTYIADIDNANNAKEVAKAINQFADNMEKLQPQMKKVSEKYPELKDKNNQPEELKPSQKEAEAVGQEFVGTFKKIMTFMDNPEVKKAQERLSAAMSK